VSRAPGLSLTGLSLFGSALTGATLMALSPAARAARPDELRGSYSFDAADELDFVDGPAGVVRVHFSRSGPNQTLLDDEDLSGAPDFAEAVAASAEAVLELYAGIGLRPPVPEEELGLEALGGSGAFDFYLVDFAGVADGLFSVDDCAGDVCVGHMRIENDFEGYGYRDLDEAVSTLTSHELFHAVQAAYARTLPVWLSEGTAVWAQRRFDPDSRDFLGFCDAYLTDPGRSLDRPPAGAVTAFSYGTALYFEHLSDRHGVGVVDALLAEMAGRPEEEGALAIDAALGAFADSLGASWAAFAPRALATGRRSGALTGAFDFAHQIGPMPLEAEADGLLEDDHRFYPLASSAFRVDHAGGPVALAVADPADGVVFTLHPVQGGEADGPIEDAVVTWTPADPGLSVLADELPAGGYLLLGAYAQQADESRKIAFCFGPPDAAAACLGPDDTGGPAADSGAPAADTGGDADSGPDGGAKAGGCGCASGGARAPGGAALLGLLGIGALRRRRGRA